MPSKNGPKPSLFVEVGQRFGHLVVTDADARIGVKSTKPNGWRAAVCQCDCGAKTTVTVSGLVHGKNKSCGTACTYSPSKVAARSPEGRMRAAGLVRSLTPEQEARRLATTTTHGFAARGNPDPLYRIWRHMLRRCENPAAQSYPRYGGRGIAVSPQWHDVRVFIADVKAEIGPRPEGKYPSGHALYSLDRIDNNRDYESGNVKWSTGVEQQANTSRPGPSQCSEDGCDRAARSRGMCDKHYKRWWKANRPQAA